MKILLDKTPSASALASANSSSSRQTDSDLSPDDLFSFLIAETQNKQVSTDEVIDNQMGGKQGESFDETAEQELLSESMMQLLAIKLNMQDNSPDQTKLMAGMNQGDKQQLQYKTADLAAETAQAMTEKLLTDNKNASQGDASQQNTTVNNALSAMELQEPALYDALRKSSSAEGRANKDIDVSALKSIAEPDMRTKEVQTKEVRIANRQPADLMMHNPITSNNENVLVNTVTKFVDKLSDIKNDYPPIMNQVVDRSVELMNMVSQYRQQALSQPSDLTANAQTNLLTVAERSGIKTEHFLDGSIEINEPSSMELGKMTYHVRLKIYPPDLGKISARLKLDDNRADLFFTAENERVSQILKQHLPELKDQLNAAMIKVDILNVHISSNNEQFGEKEGKSNARQLQEMSYQEDRAPAAQQKQVADKKENKSDSMIDAYI